MRQDERGWGAVTVGRLLPLLAGVVLLAGCGGDEPAAAPVQPVSPSSSPSSASPSPSPSPTPSPSPSPLSAFEDDPAVQALRAYLVAMADAVNTQNLQNPALLAVSTARRAGLHQELYGDAFGEHYPGPNPVAVLGVRTASPTTRNVLVCSLEDGHALDRPGGTPTEPADVVGGQFELVLEDGRWKVNRALAAEDVTCDGVPLQPPAQGATS